MAGPLLDIFGYTIAFTVRSGSNLLCDYLRDNHLGAPTEYFQHPLGIANRHWYDQLGVPYDDTDRFVRELALSTMTNGCFGSKMTWDHKNVLLADIRQRHPDLLHISQLYTWHAWVYLYREDKIAQAVSLWRAIESGEWLSYEHSTASPPAYDFFRILSLLTSLLVEDLLWRQYFASLSEPVFIVSYETLVAQPRETVAQLSEHLARFAPRQRPLAVDEVVLPQRLLRQRDSFSAETCARVKADLEHIGVEAYWADRRHELTRWSAFFAESQWK